MGKMLEFSKRLGLCLGIAAAFTMAACDDDSGSSGNSGSNEEVECSSNEECTDSSKPVCKEGKCIADETQNENKDECSSDSDCKDSSKPKCNTKTKKCEAGEGGGGGDDVKTECPSGQEACGETCADLKNDSNHCGNCDTACTDGKSCIDGSCDFACDGEEPDKCDDGCFNFKSDPKHCGSCSKACGEGESCTDGNCVKGCEEVGQIVCGDACTNIQSDNKNCGECGKACGDGTSCVNGVCKKSCDAPKILCENDNECYDLDSDETCGTCDSHTACNTAANEHCSANRICEGPCPDSAKPDQCGEICVNLKTDPEHCGGCEGEEHVCGDNKVCSDGLCVTECGDGYVEYQGVCVSKTDPTHCGLGSEDRDDSIPEGGIDCTSLDGVLEAACEEGACKIGKCSDNYAVCEANPHVCTDLRSPDSCGKCDQKCEDPNAIPEKTTCLYNAEKPEESVCNYVCKEGMTSCNGACKDLQNDKENCGFCGNACDGDATCVNGFCTLDTDKCTADANSNMYLDAKIKGQPVKLFCVRTAAELASIAKALNAGNFYPADNKNKNYIIATDIDLGTKTWTPIGTSSVPYSGIFFGNGKEIKGTLTVSGTYSGFFGYVKSAMLDGFNLKIDIRKTDSSDYLGALAGYVVNSTLNGSKQDGKVEGYLNVGGMYGGAEDFTVTHCSTSGLVTASSDYAAGLAGRIIRNTITDAHSSATVKSDSSSGQRRAGGLIGLLTDSTVSDCSASGDVTGKSDSAGGLIGWIWSTNQNSVVKKSFATGNVTGIGSVGGLIGYDYGQGLLTVEDCYATGDVTGTSSSLGGLIGRCANGANHKTVVKRSYASGTVSTSTAGALYIGGLIGYLEHGEITDSYFIGEIHKDKTGRSTSGMGGIVGYAYDVSMKNLYVNSKGISGSLALGGIAGYAISNSKIENAWVKADLFSSWARVGGIVGEVRDNTTLSNVLYSGKISAIREDGGMVGWLEGAGTLDITNAAVLGEIVIYEEGNSQLGGFIGLVNGDKNTIIRNSYVMATLTNELAPQHKYIVQSNAGKTTMKNSYHWKEMGTKLSQVDLPEASIFPFIYDNDNEPAVEVGKQKLWDALGSANWKKGNYTKITIDNSIPGLPVEKKTPYVVPIPAMFDANIVQ